MLFTYFIASSRIGMIPHTHSGPSHMAIYMSTETGTELVKWSFANEEPLHTVSWDGKPTYFIYHSYGEIADPWTFWFDVKVSHLKCDFVLKQLMSSYFPRCNSH